MAAELPRPKMTITRILKPQDRYDFTDSCPLFKPENIKKVKIINKQYCGKFNQNPEKERKIPQW